MLNVFYHMEDAVVTKLLDRGTHLKEGTVLNGFTARNKVFKKQFKNLTQTLISASRDKACVRCLFRIIDSLQRFKNRISVGLLSPNALTMTSNFQWTNATLTVITTPFVFLLQRQVQPNQLTLSEHQKAPTRKIKWAKMILDTQFSLSNASRSTAEYCY